MSGKEFSSKKVLFKEFDYLMGANELAEKWNLSNLSVHKFAAWILHESDSGVRGNNPSNIRPKKDENFYYHPGNVWEIISGKKVFADPNNPKDPIRKFRYYDTLGDGLEASLDWLVRLHPSALKTLLDDDKSAYDFGFMLGTPNIKKQKFYTADQKEYATAVQTRFDQIVKAC